MGLVLSQPVLAHPMVCPKQWGIVTASEALGRWLAAYLSLISTSSGSHSWEVLSSSGPMVQTSGARGASCPSSVCWLCGYSWPSHSSSESEEELSSELESSLDVVSYLGGDWVGAGCLLSGIQQWLVPTCAGASWKTSCQGLVLLFSTQETFSTYWTQCQCQLTLIFTCTVCSERTTFFKQNSEHSVPPCLSSKIILLCSE